MIIARLSLRDATLGVAYFAAAAVALSLTRYDGGLAFLWPAAPLLISVLMLRPRRQWRGALMACGAASFLATGLFGLGWSLALPFVAINLAEATLAAAVYSRLGHGRRELGSVPWLLKFVLSVGIIAPAASGLLAAATLGLAGRSALDSFLQYFAGHALGNITFIPVVTLILRGRLIQALRLDTTRRAIETIMLLGFVIVTAALVFSQSAMPLLFLPMLPIILATFRLGQSGAAISIVILALIGGGLTLAGLGPVHLIQASVGGKTQLLQFYLAATVLTVLPVAADLRNRARLHQELRRSEERYRLLTDHSTDIILHVDRVGQILYASPSIRQLGGYDPDSVIGSNIMSLVPAGSQGDVRRGHMTTVALAGGTHSYRHLARTASGEDRWFESHSRALLDEHGTIDGTLSIVRDISRQVSVEARLEVAAMTDSLTGLANRRAFRARVQELVEGGVGLPISIAVVDIDHFKRVNDLYGHDAGDEVLQSFAAIAHSVVRRGDLVARLGGEEFALLLPGIGRADAIAICERLRQEVAETVSMTDAGPVCVTISGGVIELGDRGLDAALKEADEALYQAKARGRDRMQLAA